MSTFPENTLFAVENQSTESPTAPPPSPVTPTGREIPVTATQTAEQPIWELYGPTFKDRSPETYEQYISSLLWPEPPLVPDERSVPKKSSSSRPKMSLVLPQRLSESPPEPALSNYMFAKVQQYSAVSEDNTILRLNQWWNGTTVFSSVEMRGLRKTMEDRSVACTNHSGSRVFLMVFDGHDGASCAIKAAKTAEAWIAADSEHKYTGTECAQKLANALSAVCNVEETHAGGGSTATIAVVTYSTHPRYADTAAILNTGTNSPTSVEAGLVPPIVSCVNIGDSYAAIWNMPNGTKITDTTTATESIFQDITEHHTPEACQEEVKSRGGFVFNGRVGCLALGRVLGDMSEPYIGHDFSQPRSFALFPNHLLCVASDGLWNLRRKHIEGEVYCDDRCSRPSDSDVEAVSRIISAQFDHVTQNPKMDSSEWLSNTIMSVSNRAAKRSGDNVTVLCLYAL